MKRWKTANPKEGGHPVERRPLRQWILKITAYADRLLEDLALLDWPESLKRLQINWIGKSEGAQATFKVQHTGDEITVFTTRSDTLFGATFIVLAPEHPLVSKIVSPKHRTEVEAYQKMAAAESDLYRTELNQEKTGVFLGSYAINPVNGQPIPIWIADYVLMSYGTGAIMAVPAHDERDFDFAKKFGLKIIPVKRPDAHRSDQKLFSSIAASRSERAACLTGQLCWPGEGEYINSQNSDISLAGLSTEDAKERVTAWLEKKGLGKRITCYKLRDWLFSRQRYWGEPFPILHYQDGSKRVLGLDELPLTPPQMSDFKPTGDGQSPSGRCANGSRLPIPRQAKRHGEKAIRCRNGPARAGIICAFAIRIMRSKPGVLRLKNIGCR